MWLRPFLAFSALAWLPYGLLCWLQPELLAGIAGVAAGTTTGTVELRAMYGGLQVALGVLSAAAFLRPSLRRPALIALSFVGAGLFTARGLGALLACELSGYTAGALLFELFLSVFATRLLVALPGAESRATG